MEFGGDVRRKIEALKRERHSPREQALLRSAMYWGFFVRYQHSRQLDDRLVLDVFS